MRRGRGEGKMERKGDDDKGRREGKKKKRLREEVKRKRKEIRGRMYIKRRG